MAAGAANVVHKVLPAKGATLKWLLGHKDSAIGSTTGLINTSVVDVVAESLCPNGHLRVAPFAGCCWTSPGRCVTSVSGVTHCCNHTIFLRGQLTCLIIYAGACVLGLCHLRHVRISEGSQKCAHAKDEAAAATHKQE